MKLINLMLAVITILLTGMSECQRPEVKAEATVLDRCKPRLELPELKAVEGEEAVIEKFTQEVGTVQQSFYLVKYPSVPTGYLTVCNLPNDYRENGLRIKFSGIIYKIEDVERQNRNSIPAEFSIVQKIIDN